MLLSLVQDASFVLSISRFLFFTLEDPRDFGPFKNYIHPKCRSNVLKIVGTPIPTVYNYRQSLWVLHWMWYIKCIATQCSAPSRAIFVATANELSAGYPSNVGPDICQNLKNTQSRQLHWIFNENAIFTWQKHFLHTYLTDPV